MNTANWVPDLHDLQAVCNLGSANLFARTIERGGLWSLDHEKPDRTVRTAMRMLDDVIDMHRELLRWSPQSRHSSSANAQMRCLPYTCTVRSRL